MNNESVSRDKIFLLNDVYRVKWEKSAFLHFFNLWFLLWSKLRFAENKFQWILMNESFE